jgi:2-keto-4-pentenoate hydratase/2-oxohepta-3-ene-1,7-dioic acid hydratase in catechol pathway
MRPHVWILYACVRLLSTARDVQLEAKAKGTPWMISKSYDCFAPVSTFIPKSEVPDCHNLDLYVSRDTDCTAACLHSLGMRQALVLAASVLCK